MAIAKPKKAPKKLTLKRRDPEARRALLLSTASRHFAERGYEGTSVNEVAKDAGVSVGTLFKYFPDKAALLEAVLAEIEVDFVAAMTRPELHVGPHAPRLRPMMRALFGLAATREHFFWALTSGTQALRGKRDTTPGDALRQSIAGFVRSGIAAGEFRAVDPDRMAAIGYGVVEAAMQQCFSVEGGAHRQAWADLCAEVLARAVRPEA